MVDQGLGEGGIKSCLVLGISIWENEKVLERDGGDDLRFTHLVG